MQWISKCADEEIDRVTYIALWWKEKRCTKLLIIELSKYMNLWKPSNTKMTTSNHRTRSQRNVFLLNVFIMFLQEKSELDLSYTRFVSKKIEVLQNKIPMFS